MSRSWWYKTLFVVLLTVLAAIILIPTLFAPDDTNHPETWPNWYRWYSENIYGGRLTPGLDLQGGLHLQYEVDVDRAIERKLDDFARDIETRLAAEDLTVHAEVLEGTTISIDLGSDPDRASEVLTDVISLYPLTRASDSGGVVRLEIQDDYVDQTRRWAVDTAISTIRSRVDALGVVEPTIRAVNGTDIVVQLPGLSEDRVDEAKRLIGTTAQLEFRGLHPDNDTYFSAVQDRIPAGGTVAVYRNTIEAHTVEELRAFADVLHSLPASDPAAVPDDAIIAFEEHLSFHPTRGELLADQTRYTMVLLKRNVEMTGETLTDARPATDPQTNRPFVSLTFDNEGAERFCDVSTAYVNEQLAIVLDDIVKSAPVIEERICQGRAAIRMNTSGSYEAQYRETENLVIVLRHGALPAPIVPQFETQVGPTLGEESIRSGAMAGMIGSLAVILFMGIYYRLCGWFANIACTLNIGFILAVMVTLHATMTLPGIAGMILTVGMAVDANVIINERIREELRMGKTGKDAIATGYAKAFWTVFDAHVTSLIAAIVLAQYGSPEIKGFAVTLSIGIIASLFTGLYVTRLMFDLYVTKSRAHRISI